MVHKLRSHKNVVEVTSLSPAQDPMSSSRDLQKTACPCGRPVAIFFQIYQTLRRIFRVQSFLVCEKTWYFYLQNQKECFSLPITRVGMDKVRWTSWPSNSSKKKKGILHFNLSRKTFEILHHPPPLFCDFWQKRKGGGYKFCL